MEKRTTIIVAHRLSTIRDATRIFVLGGGAVLESGSHNELMSRNAHYARLVEAQEQKTEKGDDSKDSEERKAILALQATYFKNKKKGEEEKEQKPKTPRAADAAADKKEEVKGDVAKEDKKEEGEKKEADKPQANVSFGRVFAQSKDEWFYFAVGCFCSIVQGAAFPLFSFIFSEMITIFYVCDCPLLLSLSLLSPITLC